MMKTFYILLGLGLLCLMGCQQKATEKPQTPKLLQLPSGLQYIHYVSNEDAKKAKLKDYLKLDVRILTEGQKDTIIDTYRYADEPIYRPVKFPEYTGAPEEGLLMLHEGDSMHLFVEANKKYQHEAPPTYVEVKRDTRIEYQIKVHEVYTPEEYTALRTQKEDEAIQNYLERERKEGRTYTKHESGIYYRIEAHTEGWESRTKPTAGNQVTIDYQGRFLNNLLFDRTDNAKDPTKSTPVKFTIGQRQVIPGWEIALTQLMVEGDQMDMVIPFRYAFGDQGQEKLNVPPFATLRFKMRLQKVE